LIVAFILRIWGINFGLPHIYHTDEWFEVKRALKLGAGVFEFERVKKGGYFYLLFMEYGVYFVILKIFGIIKSSDEFLFKIFQDPTPIWLIGRVTTAIIGTINVFILYLLGKRAFSKGVGIFAGFFLAIHFIHVQSSHYITVDVPLTCLLTICFLIMYCKVSDSNFNCLHYSLLGLFSALAIMTKIPGAVILLTVAIFHFKNIDRYSLLEKFKGYLLDKRIWYFAAVFTVVFLAGNPGIISKLPGIVSWLLSFFNFKDSLAPVPEFPQVDRPVSSIQYYLNIIFPMRMLILNLFIWGGIIVSFFRNYPKQYLFLSFLIPYFFFLSTSKNIEHIYPRYALPMVPILCIYGGVFLDYVIQKFGKFAYVRTIIVALLIICVFPVIKKTIAFDQGLTKPDTRTIAKIWVHQNISTDNIVIIEGSIVNTSPTTVPLKVKPDIIDIILSRLTKNKNIEGKKKFFEIFKKSLKNEKTYKLILMYNKDQLRDALRSKIGDFIILRDKTKRALEIEENWIQFPQLSQLVSWTKSGDFELVKVFEPNKETRGPKLLVYKRKNSTNL
jgi:hypothetical protein